MRDFPQSSVGTHTLQETKLQLASPSLVILHHDSHPHHSTTAALWKPSWLVTRQCPSNILRVLPLLLKSRELRAEGKGTRRAVAPRKARGLIFHPRKWGSAFENRALPPDWSEAAPYLAAGGHRGPAPSQPTSARTGSGCPPPKPGMGGEASPPSPCPHLSLHHAAVADVNRNCCLLLIFQKRETENRLHTDT